jgi:hypothetical protein
MKETTLSRAATFPGRSTQSHHSYIMCYAQLTQRESLRDIEDCLKAAFNKLYHFGIRHAIPTYTLAKGNELRNWRLYADFTRVLVDIAHPMYQNGNHFRLDTDNLVHAFDSSTISLCLVRCPWAAFRENKGGIKSVYGTSQSAVFYQIWIALSMYLIIAISKKRWRIDHFLTSSSQIYVITLFKKAPLNELFTKSSPSVPVDDSPNLFKDNHF